MKKEAPMWLLSKIVAELRREHKNQPITQLAIKQALKAHGVPVAPYVSRCSMLYSLHSRVAICRSWKNPRPQPTLAERLDEYKTGIAANAIRAMLMSRIANLSLELKVGDEPSVRQIDYYGDPYSRRCPYRRLEHRVAITIPRTWRSQVWHTELYQSHSDRFILTGLPVENEKLRIYKASWLRVKRATVTLEHGYIGVVDTTCQFFSSSLRACKRMVLKEIKYRQKRHAMFGMDAKPEQLAKDYGDVVVHVIDSIRAGNCRADSTRYAEKMFGANARSAKIADIVAKMKTLDADDYVKGCILDACIEAICRRSPLHVTGDSYA